MGEMAHADDDDLAQAPVERGLPTPRVGGVEPALGQRRAVEQHAIDVDQPAAAAGAELLDELGEFGMVLLVDQGNASHGHSNLKLVAFIIGVQRASSTPTRCCASIAPDAAVGSKPDATSSLPKPSSAI